MRALLCVGVLLTACRDRPAAPLTVADAATDTLGAALAELEDVGDAMVYTHDVTIVSIAVTPKTALPGASDTLRDERWRFRPCAVHVTGPLTTSLTARVGEGGEVISSTAEAPAELSRCLCDAAQKMKFAEPAGGHASIELSLKYAPR